MATNIPPIFSPRRAPLSVLAVRPSIKAPPLSTVSTQVAPPPTIPVRSINSAPYIPIPVSSQLPTLVPPVTRSNSVRSTTESLIPVRTSMVSTPQSTAVALEGRLLPIMPSPYEEVMEPTPGLSGVLTPTIEIVMPKVASNYIPRVVPEIAPRSPPNYITRSRTSARSPFPTGSIVSQPALMTGMTPPVNDPWSGTTDFSRNHDSSISSVGVPSIMIPAFATIPSLDVVLDDPEITRVGQRAALQSLISPPRSPSTQIDRFDRLVATAPMVRAR